MDLVGSGFVSFDTDPDSGYSHFLIRIRIQGNDTDSTNPDPDPQHCPGQDETLNYLPTKNKMGPDVATKDKTELRYLPRTIRTLRYRYLTRTRRTLRYLSRTR